MEEWQFQSMTFLTIIQFFVGVALSLPIMVIVCKHQKQKQIYKPGHIPEFENPENEETDTYYGLSSSRLFPDREKGRVNKAAMEDKKSEGGVEGVSETQPTKDLNKA